MKALEFIKMMNGVRLENTDISAPTWATMRRIAAHYEQCPNCRTAYDEMEYDDEDLLQIAARIESSNEADWVCQEVA